MSEPDWLAARFRQERPRALAALNRIFRNLDLAEDALAIACERAVSAWGRSGVPADPLAWLLTVARNAGLDIVRRERRREQLLATAAEPDGTDDEESLHIGRLDEGDLGDDVLRLLFICCHPALSPQDQSALALRVVAGLSVEEIASAFLVRFSAMEKRLVRAKAQIASANSAFETPGPAERLERLRVISLMIYLMFNEGWSASSGPVQVRTTLCEEAIRLARLLLRLFPSVAELQGLLALLLFHFARRDGRTDAEGRPLTLDEQDRRSWDKAMIAEAASLLEKALRHGEPGPLQVQAAIAGAHASAATAAETDWAEIERLYRLLVILEPTPVVRLNHAAATTRTSGPDEGLKLLEPLTAELSGYRWFHTSRGGLLLELGRYGEAKAAFERALELGPTAPERRILDEKIALCLRSLPSALGASGPTAVCEKN
jgi:RNA polymerase sigma-70 factor (ECF subfamily)